MFTDVGAVLSLIDGAGLLRAGQGHLPNTQEFLPPGSDGLGAGNSIGPGHGMRNHRSVVRFPLAGSRNQ